MPRVGLVGGLGPESTIDYYRRILEAWGRVHPGSAPAIVIDSLDVQRALQLVATDRAALTEYLAESVGRLAAARVDFVALTANTPHIVFDALAAGAAVPLLSIVEVCAHEARSRGLRRMALLGTRFTMEAPFYPEVFTRHGVEITLPTEPERTRIHDRYIGELLKGDFRDETRAEITSIVERMVRDDRIDGVVLGGTELPLLLGADTIGGVPALDTTGLHVAAIVARLLNGVE